MGRQNFHIHLWWATVVLKLRTTGLDKYLVGGIITWSEDFPADPGGWEEPGEIWRREIRCHCRFRFWRKRHLQNRRRRLVSDVFVTSVTVAALKDEPYPNKLACLDYVELNDIIIETL